MSSESRISNGSVIAGKYRVLGFLGRGGFGDVYLVEMTEDVLHSRLALKMLRSKYLESERHAEQFKHEIRTAMRIVNKYVVPIRDVGTTEDGRIYYTMDFVEGSSLDRILRDEGALRPQRAIRIGRRILSALVSAHAAGVVHRDLKPANVMIGRRPDGKDAVFVLDFGLATRVGSESVSHGVQAGTKRYMSPEQFRGDEVGTASDLYSVGVILYEALSGRLPHEGASPQAIYDSMQRGPAPLVEVAPQVRSRPGLAAAVHKALEVDPANRWSSAREFLAALQSHQSPSADPSAPPPVGCVVAKPRAPRPRRHASSRPRGAPVVQLAAVLAVAVAVVIVLASLPRDEPRSDSPPRAASAPPREENPPPVVSSASSMRRPDVAEGAREDRAGPKADEAAPSPPKPVARLSPSATPPDPRPPVVVVPPQIVAAGDVPIVRFSVIDAGDEVAATVRNERSGDTARLSLTPNVDGVAEGSVELFVPAGHECEVSIAATDAGTGLTATSRTRVVVPPAASSAPRGRASPIETDAVNLAIRNGASHLRAAAASYLDDLTKRGGVGTWQERANVALVMFALVQAGVSIGDPVVQAGFDFLEHMPLDRTYPTSCYASALMAALAQADEIRQLRPPNVRVRAAPSVNRRLGECIEALVNSQQSPTFGGAWSYTGSPSASDLSNTHFAVLALAAASHRRAKIDRRTWPRILDALGRQREASEGSAPLTLERRGEGTTREESVYLRGFRYRASQGATTWNMTCAGLACYLMIPGSEPGSAVELESLAWLSAHWGTTGRFYGAYVLEKVGSFARLEKIDGHDWFAELADQLLRTQQQNGSWPQVTDQTVLTSFQATSLALLTLGRSTESLFGLRSTREVVSGSTTATAAEDPSWVRVEERGYHVPTLLRRVHLAPELLGLVEKVAEHYPERWRGELVPSLVVLLDKAATRSERQRVHRLLEGITGYRDTESATYDDWYRRWSTVESGVVEGDLTEWLLAARDTTERSTTLRRAILDRLASLRTVRALPACLEDMAHEDDDVRAVAASCYRGVFAGYSGRFAPPEFDPDARQRDREAQLAALLSWYDEARSSWLKGW